MIAPPVFAAAACVLAETRAGALDAVVSLLVAARLAPIVAVVAPGTPVPVPARAVHVESRRRDAGTALRFGLTQLLNAPVAGALVVDLASADPTLEAMLAVLDVARRTGAPLAALPGETGPVFAHRDAWREILTTPGGLESVLARHAAAVARAAPRG